MPSTGLDPGARWKGRPASNAAIEVLDPVNVDNNVGELYGTADRDRIVGAAHKALDALTEARFAPTKGRALDCWRVILGPTFKG